ncbi:MAG: type II secretion system F family protein [Lentisphaeria bacterium]|nr:type II secretion system F family protein [Lentisphaeria bacterium]
MASYTYKALRADGSAVFGQLDAAGRQEAFGLLDRQGLRPVDLREGAGGTLPAGPGLRRRRIPARVLEAFTRQLASLLAAGVPLSQALHLLWQEADERHKGYWRLLHDEVVDGTSLSQAMARQADIFPKVYSAMVNAGETGGFLDVVLRQIAAFQTRERDLRSKVLGAMIYPAVLAGLSIAVLAFLLVFFIPRFEGIFADFGAALPALTRFIVDLSLRAQRYGVVVLLALAAALLAARRFLVSPGGRRRAQAALLRLPVFGAVASRFAMTRFCRMLGTLTQAGVPLIHALRVARESLANEVLAEAVDNSIEQVQHGDRLGASLAGCPLLFPHTVVAMITIAEQTGRLGEELIRLAEDAEEELDRRLRAAVALAEPALLFLMASLVGTIVIGMVLPIFAIQDYIK